MRRALWGIAALAVVVLGCSGDDSSTTALQQDASVGACPDCPACPDHRPAGRTCTSGECTVVSQCGASCSCCAPLDSPACKPDSGRSDSSSDACPDPCQGGFITLGYSCCGEGTVCAIGDFVQCSSFVSFAICQNGRFASHGTEPTEPCDGGPDARDAASEGSTTDAGGADVIADAPEAG